MIRICRKIPQKQLWTPPPKKKQNEKPLVYAATYKIKDNPELFTEIIKNLKELKSKEKIQRNTRHNKSCWKAVKPKIFKKILTSSTFGENTTQGVTKC